MHTTTLLVKLIPLHTPTSLSSHHPLAQPLELAEEQSDQPLRSQGRCGRRGRPVAVSAILTCSIVDTATDDTLWSCVDLSATSHVTSISIRFPIDPSPTEGGGRAFRQLLSLVCSESFELAAYTSYSLLEALRADDTLPSVAAAAVIPISLQHFRLHAGVRKQPIAHDRSQSSPKKRRNSTVKVVGAGWIPWCLRLSRTVSLQWRLSLARVPVRRQRSQATRNIPNSRSLCTSNPIYRQLLLRHQLIAA